MQNEHDFIANATAFCYMMKLMHTGDSPPMSAREIVEMSEQLEKAGRELLAKYSSAALN